MAEMTLQEAIDHAREVANGLHPNIDGCSECAKQHGQLADWLEELWRFKHDDVVPVSDFNEAFFTISRAYKEDPSNKILRDYLLKNACCMEGEDGN